jgi:hypothetical protein
MAASRKLRIELNYKGDVAVTRTSGVASWRNRRKMEVL